LGIHSASSGAPQGGENSPLDAAVFGVLLAAGIIVLMKRKRRVSKILAANWPILIYFAYCLLSVLWSDFPGIASKRWIKALGDLAMVLVLVTEVHPIFAFDRVIARAGYVLMPLSVLFIKYFGNLGRAYSPDGALMNTGVTTNKNELGVITLVIALGAVWRLLELFLAKRKPNRAKQLTARGILVVFCVGVLAMAHSATSIACFILGTTVLFVPQLRWVKRRPARVHMLVAIVLIGGGVLTIVGAESVVIHALGRHDDLTGRKDIWAAVVPVCPNPLVGAGFESFWIGPRLQKVYSGLSSYMHVNEAHNGYIEVYLNLGLIGLILIASILVNGYRQATAAFQRNRALGGLMLAYVAAAAAYGVTEAGFRMLNPMWFFLLLAAGGSTVIASSVSGSKARRPVQNASLRGMDVAAGEEPTFGLPNEQRSGAA
jgi:O-antigen ligase